MPNISFGERMQRGRKTSSWTQAQLAGKLGVTQAAISNWETDRVVPSPEQKSKIREVLGLNVADAADVAGVPPADGQERVGPSAFGNWLNRVRLEQHLSVADLSFRASVSIPAIYNIESGRIESPRSETVRKLETALGQKIPAETKKEVREEAKVEGVGEFFEFDPHDKTDWPSSSGIYVLYDVSERPIYVGQGTDIKSRIRDHEEKFWFKYPIVSTAAYVKIDDELLRTKIEKILIRFLKRNAVINKQNVDR
jgi:transcriptional regulator with XRE-family HTH domain